MKNIAVTFILILVGSTSAAAAEVWIVDPNGGGDFTSLSEAVSHASDGDTVLVKPGTFEESSPIVIDGKSLIITGEYGAKTFVFIPEMRVQNLDGSQSLTVRNLSLLGPTSLSENIGTVWFEDSDLWGALGDETTTVVIDNCESVALTRSTLIGSPGFSFIGRVDAEDALSIHNSFVSIYDSSVIGGSGVGGQHSGDVPGAHGCVVEASFVFVSNSEVLGGESGTEPGGDGLRLESGGPVVDALDLTLHGGAGNPAGEALVVHSGTFTELEGSHRSAAIHSPTRVGGIMTLVFDGAPGDFVLLHHSLATSSIYLRPLQGVLLVSPIGLRTNAIGHIPQAGQLILDVQTPSIFGMESLSFFTQATFLSTVGKTTLSSPSVGTILDPQF